MTYTVKSGDSLYSIADKYGITVADIKNANNLKKNGGHRLATYLSKMEGRCKWQKRIKK